MVRLCVRKARGWGDDDRISLSAAIKWGPTSWASAFGWTISDAVGVADVEEEGVDGVEKVGTEMEVEDAEGVVGEFG